MDSECCNEERGSFKSPVEESSAELSIRVCQWLTSSQEKWTQRSAKGDQDKIVSSELIRSKTLSAKELRKRSKQKTRRVAADLPCVDLITGEEAAACLVVHSTCSLWTWHSWTFPRLLHKSVSAQPTMMRMVAGVAWSDAVVVVVAVAVQVAVPVDVFVGGGMARAEGVFLLVW